MKKKCTGVKMWYIHCTKVQSLKAFMDVKRRVKATYRWPPNDVTTYIFLKKKMYKVM